MILIQMQLLMLLTVYRGVAALVFLLVQIVESLVDSKAADALLCDQRDVLYTAVDCGDAAAVVKSKPLLHNMSHVISVFEER